MEVNAVTASRAQTAPAFFSEQVSEARRFYLDLNPPKGSSLAVVCGGVEHTRSDYRIFRETFPFYSLEYVARGRGTVRLDEVAHALQAGRVFSYEPGIRHEITSDPAEPMVKYFIDFAGTRARGLLTSCGLKPGSVGQVFPPNELQGVFDELIHCALRGTRHSATLCEQLLRCLLLKMADSRAPVEGAEKLAYSTYQQCRQHIKQHFKRLKNLEQVSAECHVNDAYLCRLFRRYDRQSPYQYLVWLKMNHAAEQLQQPGALIKQVAEANGFEDQFHFSRAFKRVFGVSPAAFRRMR